MILFHYSCSSLPLFSPTPSLSAGTYSTPLPLPALLSFTESKSSGRWANPNDGTTDIPSWLRIVNCKWRIVHGKWRMEIGKWQTQPQKVSCSPFCSKMETGCNFGKDNAYTQQRRMVTRKCSIQRHHYICTHFSIYFIFMNI